jgi:hypothetical protein
VLPLFDLFGLIVATANSKTICAGAALAWDCDCAPSGDAPAKIMKTEKNN